MPPLPLIPNQPAGATDIVPNRTDVYSASTNGSSPYGNAADTAWKEALAEEQRRQFDLDYNQKKQQLDQTYQLGMQTAKTAQQQQAATAQYQQAQTQLAQARLAQEQQQFGMTQAQQESQFARTFGLDQSKLAETRREFDVTGQLDQAKLGENKRQFDVTKAQQDQQFGITSGMTQQQIDAQIQQFGVTSGMTQQQIDAQKAQYQQTFGQQAHQFDVTSGETAREFDVNTGLAQARLGYDVTNQQAQYEQHPEDYWIAADNLRGVANNPGTATFIDALRNNSGLRGYGAQAGTPQVASYNGLLNREAGAAGQTQNIGSGSQAYSPGGVLEGNVVSASSTPAQGSSTGYGTPAAAQPSAGGGTVYAGGSSTFNESGGGYAPSGGGQAANGGYQAPNAARDAQNLGAIRDIYNAGAHRLAPGSLESLNPTEFALFKSGISKAGGDADGFLSQYRQSRIGNTANARAA